VLQSAVTILSHRFINEFGYDFIDLLLIFIQAYNMIKSKHDLVKITFVNFEVFLDFIDFTALSQSFKELIC
jgi:hypothetical protein